MKSYALAKTSTSSWQIHRGHLILLGAWMVVFAAVYVADKRRSRPPDRRIRLPDAAPLHRTHPACIAAVAGTFVAAAVHLTIIREHFSESWLYGTFFLVLTLVQFAFCAALLRRPSRRLVLAGAAASSLVVVLWIATRTTGIPLGPAAGETEPVGVADTIASAAETVVALAALVLVGVRRPGPRTAHPAHASAAHRAA